MDRINRRKAVVSELVITTIASLLIGLVMFLVFFVNVPVMMGYDTVARWAGLGIRNNMILASTTESSVIHYSLVSIGPTHTVVLTIDNEKLWIKHKLGSSDCYNKGGTDSNCTFYHFISETAEGIKVKAKTLEGSSFCIAKYYDISCQAYVEVCKERESCCTPTYRRCPWPEEALPGAVSVPAAAAASFTQGDWNGGAVSTTDSGAVVSLASTTTNYLYAEGIVPVTGGFELESIESGGLMTWTTTGSLFSVVLDAGKSSVEWGKISWNADTPLNTQVYVVNARTCDNKDKLLADPTGAVSGCAWTTQTSGSNLVSSSGMTNARYLQYQVVLKGDGTKTPTFDWIKMEYQ